MRWFAPNRFCTLVVPRLRELGLTIALDGDRPARLAIAMDAQVVAAAYRYAVRHQCPLIHYLWDLPPWRLAHGQPDWIWFVHGRFLRLPRPYGGYVERRGYYSRLHYVAARARELWTPSAATAHAVAERFGLDSTRVPYCYDSDRFRPAPARGPRSASLLSVSRLTPQKNHAALIRAAAAFTPKLVVRIIGSGGEHDALARLAAASEVSCTIESGVDDAALLAAYRAAGVVVCPSRFEGFGLTPMEAIACGVPVVASDIPPHREFLGTAPSYFALDDDAALVRAIAEARSAGPPPQDVLQGLTIEAAAQRFFDRLGGLRM